MCQKWPRLTPGSPMCLSNCLASAYLSHDAPWLVPIQGSTMCQGWVRRTPGSAIWLWNCLCSAPATTFPSWCQGHPYTLKSTRGQICAKTDTILFVYIFTPRQHPLQYWLYKTCDPDQWGYNAITPVNNTLTDWKHRWWGTLMIVRWSQLVVHIQGKKA